MPDFSIENLKYLSSRQALADLALFHDYATDYYQLAGSPWVVFGGSYSGALAAWSRKLYPSLFTAAVASSAPLRAEANFVGYQNVVASALTAYSVGGDPQCLGIIAQGHAQIRELLKTESHRRELERKFALCGERVLDNPDNVANWAGQGVIITAPQYNSQRCDRTSCNIALLCGNLSEIASNATPIDALVQLRQHQQQEMLLMGYEAQNCTDISYAEQLPAWQSTAKVNASSDAVDAMLFRLWTYQGCTEFGWFQSCEDGSGCPFTKGYNTLNWSLDLCKELFNLSHEEVLANIQRTNDFYGELNYNATNVVFPNGEVDPWHWVSVIVAPQPSVDTVFVPGASHCEWMHETGSWMSKDLVRAKNAIQNKISAWLEADKAQTLTLGFLSKRPKLKGANGLSLLQFQATLLPGMPTPSDVEEL